MMDNGGKGKPSERTGSAAGLEALLANAGDGGLSRPVDDWNPPYCGDIGLAIRADGVWTYQGGPIRRDNLVKLFASILRKDEDGRTYLVTPAEKVDVAVADAPFLAVEMAVSGSGKTQALTFRTNVDDVVTAGAANPMRFVSQAPPGGPKPYIRVRGRLDALLTRGVYMELAALVVPGDSGTPGVWSGGMWWPFE